MTARRPRPAAPGPLEGYAAEYDPLFRTLAQRRGFRDSVAGLLRPRDRNKTLTERIRHPSRRTPGGAEYTLRFGATAESVSSRSRSVPSPGAVVRAKRIVRRILRLEGTNLDPAMRFLKLFKMIGQLHGLRADIACKCGPASS